MCKLNECVSGIVQDSRSLPCTWIGDIHIWDKLTPSACQVKGKWNLLCFFSICTWTVLWLFTCFSLRKPLLAFYLHHTSHLSHLENQRLLKGPLQLRFCCSGQNCKHFWQNSIITSLALGENITWFLEGRTNNCQVQKFIAPYSFDHWSWRVKLAS